MSHVEARFGKHRGPARRLSAAALLAFIWVLVVQPAALAHVSITPDSAEPGESATVAFRVPNERDDSSTTGLMIAIPGEHPLASVTPRTLPGWELTLTKEKPSTAVENHGEPVTEVVTEIRWEGGEIPPGQFQEFPVRIGPLPDDVDTLVFKAVQTYADGEVVRWIDVPEPELPEPKKPAPTLTVATAEAAPPVAPPAEAGADGTTDLPARVLGIVGAVIGSTAVILLLIGRRRVVVAPDALPATADRESDPESSVRV